MATRNLGMQAIQVPELRYPGLATQAGGEKSCTSGYPGTWPQDSGLGTQAGDEKSWNSGYVNACIRLCTQAWVPGPRLEVLELRLSRYLGLGTQA